MKSKRRFRAVRVGLPLMAAGYLLLLSFPQALFAHDVVYGRFHIYANAPLDDSLRVVLDRVEAKIAASTIDDSAIRPRVFIFASSSRYAALSLFVGANSFGKGFAALPADNVFLNRSNIRGDLVFRNATENRARSLSGVIAHEITHLLVRRRYGYWRNLTFPVWKREGFAEYVAGGSTLSAEAGVRLWKANPADATGYQYFKYYMMVKYLLEHDKMSVDDLFARDIDVARLAEAVLKTL